MRIFIKKARLQSADCSVEVLGVIVGIIIVVIPTLLTLGMIIDANWSSKKAADQN